MLLRHGTEYEAFMARSTKSRGLAKRSVEWAARWYKNAPSVGQTLTTQFWLELGLKPGNFGQPQSMAVAPAADPKTGKLVQKVVNTWPRPDIAGAWDPKGFPFHMPVSADGYYTPVSPGSDHQGGVHVPPGWPLPAGLYTGWGIIGPNSGPGEVLNRLQAELGNQWNLRPANMTTDQYAWAMGFIPDGAVGNAHGHSPSVPPDFGAIGPDEVQYAIDHGQTLNRGFTMAVHRRCSMNGPIAPPSVRDCEDPLVGSQFGCSAAPALQLETTPSYYPVSGQVPDGMVLAVNRPASDIDAHLKLKKVPAGSPLYKASYLLLQNTTYSDEGHGVVQAQTGGACILPMDTSPLAVKGWAGFGFTAGFDLFGGWVRSADDIVACGVPTSIGLVDGKEWRREVLASSIGLY